MLPVVRDLWTPQIALAILNPTHPFPAGIGMGVSWKLTMQRKNDRIIRIDFAANVFMDRLRESNYKIFPEALALIVIDYDSLIIWPQSDIMKTKKQYHYSFSDDDNEIKFGKINTSGAISLAEKRTRVIIMFSEIDKASLKLKHGWVNIFDIYQLSMS